MAKMKAAIFDLDGVIVDTAKYHYLAWRRLADELGFEFTVEHNERLKGVSRMKSLEILLEVGGLDFPEDKKLEMATRKNTWYVEYISKIDSSEILDGVNEFMSFLKERNIKIALASASKNSGIILNNIGITPLFDAIADGNVITKAKPDPEVFQKAAEMLDVPYEECVVFEDAQAGIEGAKRAGMYAVGIGSKDILFEADTIVTNLRQLIENGVAGELFN